MNRGAEAFGFLALFFTMMSISTSPYPLLLILSYLIHETGHIFFAKIAKIPMRKIRLGAFHLRLRYDCSSASFKNELLVCSGGIAFNLAVVLLLLPFSSLNDKISFILLCNLSLAIMNLYPASTLDGGRIIKCILMIFLDERRANTIFKIISFVFAFLLWLCAVYLLLIFNSNISLFFISVFLLIELCFST